MNTTTPLDLVLSKLDGPRQTGPNQWEARCPAHEDHNPSLGISTGEDGRVLLKCQAGCLTDPEIVTAMGITTGDLFAVNGNGNGTSKSEIAATYDYVNEAGELLFQVVRKRPKAFHQRRPDGKGGWVWNLKGVESRPLYKLPAVLEAVRGGFTVYVCEGERDADLLQQQLPPGEVATTISGGAGKWRDEHTDALVGGDVIVLADRDKPGYAHAAAVQRALQGKAQFVGVYEPVVGKDVADHLGAGHTLEEFLLVDHEDPPVDPDAGQVDLPDGHVAIEEEYDPDNPGAMFDGHRTTDVGNSERLIAAADGTIRYVIEWDTWIVFDVFSGVWRRDPKAALVQEIAKAVAPRMFLAAAQITGNEKRRKHAWKAATRAESIHGIKAMIDLARGVPGVVVHVAELDQHPWLLNVLNGTVDLRTGALGPHDREHLLTCQAPVMYDPTATAELWDRCLQRWQPDEQNRGYLQRIAGTAITGKAVEHLFVNLGGGGNGKGKFYGAIEHVLGPDYFVVPHKSLIVTQRHEQHDTVKARLAGARMAVAGETEAGDLIDEAKVKELTGGDLLEARRMNENPWQFAPSHSLFLHTNHRPRIRGGDEGIWRRVRLIPWPVTIPANERDDTLPEKLAAEASGILNWLIAGARDWHERGLDQPDSITEATEAYRADEDHVGRFLADCATIGTNLTVTAKSLRFAYESWCHDVGETPWTAKSVGLQLTQRGFDNKRVGKNKTHIWTGFDIAANKGIGA